MITLCVVEGFDSWLHVGNGLAQQDLGRAHRCLPKALLVLLQILLLVLGGKLCNAGVDVVSENETHGSQTKGKTSILVTS